MNQGRIWCVVNPTVGLPLLLGGVATISLIVHYSVMTRTTWVGSFFQGGAKGKAADLGTGSSAALATTSLTPTFAVTVTQVPASEARSAPSFVVTVTPRSEDINEAAATGDAASRRSVVADSSGPPR